MTRILCWLLLISPAFILIGCGSSPCSSLIHNNLRSDGIWGRYYATELGGGITGRSHKGDGTLWIDLVPNSMLEMYDHGKLQRRSKFTVRWTEHAGKKRVREIVLPAVGE